MNLIVLVCVGLFLSPAVAIENGKTPLSVENPISGPSGENKDAKKADHRFDDPPPEYYKGPIKHPDQYSAYALKYNGNDHKPIPQLMNNGHVNPYLSKHGFYGPPGGKDRISAEYYGSSEYGNYSPYDSRSRPYGPPQTVDIPGGGSHSNYYSGGGGGYDSYEPQGVDWGHGGGYGGEAPTAWADKFHSLSKSSLIPIAGAALLGIAAALIVNPVLMQLGTMTMAGKRRRRRDLRRSKRDKKRDESAHGLAYRGQNETEN